MTKTRFAGKKIIVLGLGLHGGGLSITKWLTKHKAKVIVTDLKTKSELAPSLRQLRGMPIKFFLGGHPRKLLNDCHMIVQNPGVPSNHPFLITARKKGVAIENEASLFLKLCPTKKIVAVTGTRGKSTTVSLLGQMLKTVYQDTVVAGNIRDTLMFDVLDKLKEKSMVVLELSSWQLEIVGYYQLRIPSAVITNILPDHLNRYSSFADYIKAKSGIFSGQTSQDNLILNFDNAVTKKLAEQAKSKVYWFSENTKVSQGSFCQKDKVYWRYGKKHYLIFEAKDLKVPGKHNLANALAAATMALVLGVSPDKIKQTVKKFKGLHDRLELVCKINKVSYYNDTTSTSPDAAIAAINSFANKQIVLIAGGTDKNLPFQEMAQTIKRRVKALILLPGTATVKLQSELKSYKNQLLAHNMVEAVKLAYKLAPANSVVLLSPGAASFGLFRHEFDRGEKFKQALKSLS